MFLWIEGFGFGVFEVFLVGFLIFVSDNSGLGEVFSDFLNGGFFVV